MARPSKLDTDRVDRLVQAIQLGATYDLACKYAGITFQTFLNWQRKGEAQATGPYRDFADRIDGAEGNAVVKWLAVVEKASNAGDWRAAMAKLERRYPEQYGRTVHDNRHKFDARADAEAIAAEVGKAGDAAAIERIHRDLLISVEPSRREAR